VPAQPDPDGNPEPSANVLKIVDAIEDLSVKEFVWFNKLLQERLGITDADLGIGVPMAVPMAAAPAEAQTGGAEKEEEKKEKTEFDVLIEGYEASSKIKIIKEVRSMVPGLGLKEGKELVRQTTHANVDADVDNQYIAMSALIALQYQKERIVRGFRIMHALHASNTSWSHCSVSQTFDRSNTQYKRSMSRRPVEAPCLVTTMLTRTS
jgi:large subunit ribosomal protein L7/L12